MSKSFKIWAFAGPLVNCPAYGLLNPFQQLVYQLYITAIYLSFSCISSAYMTVFQSCTHNLALHLYNQLPFPIFAEYHTYINLSDMYITVYWCKYCPFKTLPLGFDSMLGWTKRGCKERVQKGLKRVLIVSSEPRTLSLSQRSFHHYNVRTSNFDF